jgi:hypothetical protein
MLIGNHATYVAERIPGAVKTPRFGITRQQKKIKRGGLLRVELDGGRPLPGWF